MSQSEKINTREHAQIFVMNSWYKEVPEEKRKIIIANSLNHCTVNKSFNIIGYLITSRRLFLTGSSETTSFIEILDNFYKRVYIGILEYRKTTYQYENNNLSEADSYTKLFTKEPFYNDHTKKLITGKKVNLPYYDSSLTRLKDYIHNYNYCSALDYAGGQSCVIVATEKREKLNV